MNGRKTERRKDNERGTENKIGNGDRRGENFLSFALTVFWELKVMLTNMRENKIVLGFGALSVGPDKETLISTRYLWLRIGNMSCLCSLHN